MAREVSLSKAPWRMRQWGAVSAVPIKLNGFMILIISGDAISPSVVSCAALKAVKCLFVIIPGAFLVITHTLQ